MQNTILNDAETAFRASIAGYPVLSDEETKGFVKLAHEGNSEAREAVICSFLKLAYKIAGNYERKGFDRMEATSWAYQGLTEAVDKWDPSKDSKFVSYASKVMASRLRDGTRSERLIPITDYAWRDISKIKNAREEFIQKFGYEPSEFELSDILGGKFTPSEVNKLLAWALNPESFDSYLSDDDDSLRLEDATGVEDDYDLD